jgi:hypothetical protein
MSESNTMVIVGCKLPNGLHLDLKNNEGELVRHTVAGANASRIVGGYGLTKNVPAEFMAKWFEQNARHPAVLNKSIFIHSQASSAHAIAKEHAEVKTGLQPLDPVKLNMLNNENGEVDKKELKKFQELQAKNPDRNRQISE